MKNKFSENTKAIIIQHHLGIIDNNTIKFLSNKNIIIIEDCALSFGSMNKKKKCGSIGDFSLFSFGKSKTYNSYIGGMLLVNNKKYLKSVKLKYSELSTISKTKNYFINRYSY